MPRHPETLSTALLAATFLWFFLPLPAEAIPVCGDGVCDGNAFPAETSTSCPEDCGGGGGTAGCTLDTCGSCQRPTVGTDLDGDLVPDALEHDLAHEFFPAILLQGASDDRDQAYLYRGKATPYTVDPFVPATASTLCMEAFECLELRFGIPYFRDTGDTFLGISSHHGDSEFFAALVRRTTSWSFARNDVNAWEMIRDFTPAHWGATGDSSRYGAYGHCSPYCRAYDGDPAGCFDQGSYCGWVPGQCFGGGDAQGFPCSFYSDEGSCFFAGGTCQWFGAECHFATNLIVCDTQDPRPRFRFYYAAEGKHGLYHSPWECDNGGFLGADACPHNRYNLRDYKGAKLQNVGQSWSSASFDTTIQYPNNCDLYHVWSGAGFAESTAYRQHFMHSFGWALPDAD